MDKLLMIKNRIEEIKAREDFNEDEYFNYKVTLDNDKTINVISMFQELYELEMMYEIRKLVLIVKSNI